MTVPYAARVQLYPPEDEHLRFETCTKKTLRDSLPIDMLFSAVSVLVVAQSSSEIPEGLMNNPVQCTMYQIFTFKTRCNASTAEPG